MLWYHDWLQHGLVADSSATDRCAFYTFWAPVPLSIFPYFPRPWLLPLQFVAFHVVRAGCGFYTFNIQDELSDVHAERELELRQLITFLESVYPEKPWFEMPSAAHSHSQECSHSSMSAEAPEALLPGQCRRKTPRCLEHGALPFGFEVRSQLLDREKVRQIRSQVMQLAATASGAVDRAGPWFFFEWWNRSTLNRIEHFVQRSPFFATLADEVKIVACGEDAAAKYTLLKEKINIKAPNSEPFEPHQDYSAGWGTYAERHVTVGLPLFDSSVGSGGLFFAPSPGRLLSQGSADLTEDDMPLAMYHPIATRVGDAVVFDSLTPHYSLANRDDAPRPILYFTYIRSPSNYDKYYADKFYQVPPDAFRVPGRTYGSGNTNKARLWHSSSSTLDQDRTGKSHYFN